MNGDRITLNDPFAFLDCNLLLLADLKLQRARGLQRVRHSRKKWSSSRKLLAEVETDEVPDFDNGTENVLEETVFRS
ncbi:hypothetical protein AVEN_107438-1 [Araneus ventricosus]|uniref:Uncharacterized protein n=1 Tax=Araneus ventricosus TaxID=182803 RepID=A0A4Y2FKZ1_ARAVE|nr:hypothetical protein AVEN_107438-1 [Araneus ventricosus]